ncbi:hypothetical protein [Arenicella xantha]|nr:hypothetical protein [Arenicella xantha]
MHKSLVLLTVIILMAIPLTVMSQSIKPDFRKTNDQVEEILSEWQSSNRILLDSRTTGLISGEIEYFKSIFGKRQYNPNYQEALNLVSNTKTLKPIVYRYLEDSLDSENHLLLRSRLVKAIGMEPGLDGSPISKTNPFRLANYNEELPNGLYKISSGGKSGTAEIETKRFLIQAGLHTILNVSTGEIWDIDEEGRQDTYRNPGFVPKTETDKREWSR